MKLALIFFIFLMIGCSSVQASNLSTTKDINNNLLNDVNEEKVNRSLDGGTNALETSTENVKKPFSFEEIDSCIENTTLLVDIKKKRRSLARGLDFFQGVLETHQESKEIIKGTISFFQRDCDNYGDNCRTADYHRRDYQKELEKERETKKDIVNYINKSIAAKREEEAQAKSFDVSCKNRKYDKALLLDVCKKKYSYEYPICSDVM